MDCEIIGGLPSESHVGADRTKVAVSQSWGALHATIFPDEYVAGGRIMGHYSAGGFTSAAAFTAGVLVAAFRWADATSLAVIKRVRVAMNVVTAVTAQAGPDVDMIVYRNYSARDGTGATAVPITADTGKMRQSMGTSVLGNTTGGNFDVTSAAGGLTAGTKSADASVSGVLPVPLTAFSIGGSSPAIELFNCYQWGQHPLILRQNEGFAVRNVTAIATGTVRYYVNVDWVETPAY